MQLHVYRCLLLANVYGINKPLSSTQRIIIISDLLPEIFIQIV